jgi:hypothetical protein
VGGLAHARYQGKSFAFVPGERVLHQLIYDRQRRRPTLRIAPDANEVAAEVPPVCLFGDAEQRAECAAERRFALRWRVL